MKTNNTYVLLKEIKTNVYDIEVLGVSKSIKTNVRLKWRHSELQNLLDLAVSFYVVRRKWERNQSIIEINEKMILKAIDFFLVLYNLKNKKINTIQELFNALEN